MHVNKVLESTVNWGPNRPHLNKVSEYRQFWPILSYIIHVMLCIIGFIMYYSKSS